MVLEEFRDELVALYPAVDVMQEFRNMKGWLIGDRKRLKTRGGVKRFITGWLSREQNRGGSATRGGGGFKPRGQMVRESNDRVFEKLMREG